MFWLIEYECMHWCGGQSHCVVDAVDEDHARDKASFFMDEQMRELFSNEIEEESEENPDFDDSCMHTVNSVVPLTEDMQEWKWFKDPVQSQFFPLVD